MNDKISILIVEDEPLIAQDISDICTEYGYMVSGVAHDMENALHLLENKKVDYVLLDIRLGNNDHGLDIGQILSDELYIPYSYITSFSDSTTLSRAKKTSPMGYLTKPFRPADVNIQIQMGISLHERVNKTQMPPLSLVNKIATDPLSEREYEVVVALCNGSSNKEISESLYISMNTVKSHLKNIFIKLDIRTRSELIKKILGI